MGKTTKAPSKEEKTMNGPNISEDDQPLRIKTVAEWLGVKEKTIRRAIDHGKIGSIKMGGLRVILRGEFKAYLMRLKGVEGTNV
jgi:excisionase family DNA binding protein